MKRLGPPGRGGSGQKRSHARGQSPLFNPLLAGTFRNRVKIQQQDLTEDTFGGFGGGVWASDDGWTDVATVWAFIQTINPTAFLDQKQFRDKQFLTQEWFNVVLRFRGDINTNMRIVYNPDFTDTANNRYLIIYSVVNRDLLKHQINLFCREGG